MNEPALEPEDVQHEQVSEEHIMDAVKRATDLGFSEFTANRASNVKYALEAYFEWQGYLNMARAGATSKRRRFARLSERDEVPHGSSHNRTMKKVATPDKQLSFEEFVNGKPRPEWKRIRDTVLEPFHAGVENILDEITDDERDSVGFREPVHAAIDITTWNFWPSPFKPEEEATPEEEPVTYTVKQNGKKVEKTKYLKEGHPEMTSGFKDSDERGYKFATITIIAADTPIVLGVEPVRDKRRWEDAEEVETTSRGLLQPKAVSSDLPPDEFDAMSIHDGIAGKTYRTGESYIIEDITTSEEANPQGDWKSVISVPIGTHGNFQAVNRAVDAFGEQDLQLASLLVTHTANNLDRVLHKREMEQQLDRLEEFASIVSHDLRNPLNVAQLRVDLAHDQYECEHLDQIRSAHDRMENLIDDRLTLAREGNAGLAHEPVTLSTVATDCWSIIESDDATLVTNLDRSIVADENSLKQLFENLFRNAVEHGGGSITVTVGELADGFYVEDNGSGIPEDERNDVFEVGYSTSNQGTGFGLRIVKQIVENHEWQIRVTDSSNGGTRFEITGIEFADE